MNRTRLLAVLNPFLILIAASPAMADPPQGVVPNRPRLPTKDGGDFHYGGILTEVTKSSITIQWPGEQPKTFVVSETLAAGQVPMKPRLLPGRERGYYISPSDMYRLTDLNVGDWVDIRYAHLGKTDIAHHICIRKRPGGRIPPLPEEAENLMRPTAAWKARLPNTPLPPGLTDQGYIAYHESMNAYWDLEDKGIAYPEKFGKDRCFPIAPLPREVKPRIPMNAP